MTAPDFPAGWLPITAAARALRMAPHRLRRLVRAGTVPSQPATVCLQQLGLTRTARVVLVNLAAAQRAQCVEVTP
jgi:hypothetical protein